MSDRRPTIFVWLLGLLWLWALPVLALPAGPTEDALFAGAHDDYCGRPELTCPRTSAANCVCYLGTRTPNNGTAPACPRPMVVLRVAKPRPAVLRYLPQPEPLPMADSFCPSVPTRPPCVAA